MIIRVSKCYFISSILLFLFVVSCSSNDPEPEPDMDPNSGDPDTEQEMEPDAGDPDTGDPDPDPDPGASNAELLFEENFDAQPDWRASARGGEHTLPPNWDSGRTDENWHPDTHPGTQPSMLIGGTPEQVYGGTGKAFVSYSEDTVGRSWESDNILTKSLPPQDELYIEFYLKFQEDFAIPHDAGQMKIFRVSSYDGEGRRYHFGNNGPTAPMVFFNWSQNNIYGVRNFHAFRCDPQATNYFCARFADAPREMNNGDMSVNWTSDIARHNPSIPDLVNGGTIPADGIVWHDQVYGNEWHKMGFYVKLNSAPGVADGIYKFMFNDQLIVDLNTIPYILEGGSMEAKWNNFMIGGNDFLNLEESIPDDAPIQERERWYAIDNIRVYTTIPQ